jgi:serine/threonine protein kinase
MTSTLQLPAQLSAQFEQQME